MSATMRLVERDTVDGIRVSLGHYAPDSVLSLHHHDFTQISFLLGGGFLERHRNRDWVLRGSAFGVKPAGLAHENRWGREGTLILSIKVSGGELEALEANAEPGWKSMAYDSSLPRLVRASLLADSPHDRDAAVWDLLALRIPVERRAGPPPAWLSSAREALAENIDGVSIAEIARSAGVHRVYFTNMFRGFFGVTPSIFRKNAMVARAISRVVLTRQALSRVAYDCEFSDQSHLCRSIKRATGFNPGLLRRLFI